MYVDSRPGEGSKTLDASGRTVNTFPEWLFLSSIARISFTSPAGLIYPEISNASVIKINDGVIDPQAHLIHDDGTIMTLKDLRDYLSAHSTTIKSPDHDNFYFFMRDSALTGSAVPTVLNNYIRQLRTIPDTEVYVVSVPVPTYPNRLLNSAIAVCILSERRFRVVASLVNSTIFSVRGLVFRGLPFVYLEGADCYPTRFWKHSIVSQKGKKPRFDFSELAAFGVNAPTLISSELLYGVAGHRIADLYCSSRTPLFIDSFTYLNNKLKEQNRGKADSLSRGLSGEIPQLMTSNLFSLAIALHGSSGDNDPLSGYDLKTWENGKLIYGTSGTYKGIPGFNSSLSITSRQTGRGTTTTKISTPNPDGQGYVVNTPSFEVLISDEGPILDVYVKTPDERKAYLRDTFMIETISGV